MAATSCWRSPSVAHRDTTIRTGAYAAAPAAVVIEARAVKTSFVDGADAAGATAIWIAVTSAHKRRTLTIRRRIDPPRQRLESTSTRRTTPRDRPRRCT